jgi:hypothetical protein
MRTYAFWFAVFAVIATSSLSSSDARDSAIQRNQLPQALQQLVEGVRADLESSGFEVLQGKWNLFRIEDCRYEIERLGFCLGNIPAAPYIILTLPLWPDEFVDEDMRTRALSERWDRVARP